MHRLQRLDRRVARREVDPVQHRERPEILIVMMDHVRMAPRQQRKRAARANDVHRLPQAVQNQHRLIERGLHTGPTG